MSETAPDEYIVSQHIGWLKMYLAEMNENNWRDMQLYAQRQVDELSEKMQRDPAVHKITTREEYDSLLPNLGQESRMSPPTTPTPTTAEIIEALRPFAAAVYNDNCDVTLDTSHLRTADFMRVSRILSRLKEAPGVLVNNYQSITVLRNSLADCAIREEAAIARAETAEAHVSRLKEAPASPSEEAVERAARAICITLGVDPDTCLEGTGGTNQPSVCHVRAWQRKASIARAALTAAQETGR